MHVDGSIPFVLLDLEKALRHRCARVVDEHVDGGAPFEHLSGDFLRPVMIGDVGDEAPRRHAAAGESFHGRRELVLQDVDQDKIEAPPAERFGTAFPDAARRAGHHRDRPMVFVAAQGSLLSIVQRQLGRSAVAERTDRAAAADPGAFALSKRLPGVRPAGARGSAAGAGSAIASGSGAGSESESGDP